MTQCISPDTKIEDTGFGYTLSIIGGKYKMIVLYWLGEFGTLRHNALHRLIGKISFIFNSRLITFHIFYYTRF